MYCNYYEHCHDTRHDGNLWYVFIILKKGFYTNFVISGSLAFLDFAEKYKNKAWKTVYQDP